MAVGPVKLRRVFSCAMPEITEEQFSAEAVAFLEANASRKAPRKAQKWGEGSDAAALFEQKDRAAERQEVEVAKQWRQKKFDAGFGWITGPAARGGRGLTSAYERLFNTLEGEFEVPNQSCFMIGLGMVAPTFLAHGTERAIDTYVKAMWRGEIVGCQLFSEPGAGSDLASLQTKAERDGDEWVITGQKVWTSGAHYCDVGEVICRNDPFLPKHKGLTGFIVDMKDPNIEVRPLRQMTGSANFNEVFFNEVRVPDWHRLGDVNQGWTVALTTLMNERAAIGAGGGGAGRGDFMSLDRLAAMLHAMGKGSDKVLRDELMQLWISQTVNKYTGQRALARVKAGALPGPEMSITKLAGARNSTALSAYVSKVLGPKLIADTGEWGTYAWSQFVLGTPGSRIAGGSDEVMRNIVGERVLGLPKEPGIDSVTPFNELTVGTQTA